MPGHSLSCAAVAVGTVRAGATRSTSWLGGAVLALVAAVAACGGGSVPRIELEGLDGALAAAIPVQRGRVHAIVFTSHECPIANAYAPTLRELAQGWAGEPVRLFLVHVGPELTRERARVHARDYDLPGTILLDPAQRLARALGATRTPEAVVITAEGPVYRGRIDDRWQALGTRAPAATTQDLRLAVAAALRGEVVPPPHPPAVGCAMPEPSR